MTFSPISVATTPPKRTQTGKTRTRKDCAQNKRWAEAQETQPSAIELLLQRASPKTPTAPPPSKRRGIKLEHSPKLSADCRASPNRKIGSSHPIPVPMPKTRQPHKSPCESPNYAAAKFTSSPSPQVLPPPPVHWVMPGSPFPCIIAGGVAIRVKA